jgi:hypothetical protein
MRHSVHAEVCFAVECMTSAKGVKSRKLFLMHLTTYRWNTKKGVSLILSETAVAAVILFAARCMDDVSAVNYTSKV